MRDPKSNGLHNLLGAMQNENKEPLVQKLGRSNGGKKAISQPRRPFRVCRPVGLHMSHAHEAVLAMRTILRLRRTQALSKNLGISL